MASVNGVSSSNASTIYGNRNIISGLASGLDTESMIENSIKGFQLKISSLQQQQTKLTWKQDAYRGISDSLVQLSQKYTSYSSASNLMSATYFNKAVVTTANGVNAAKVSATGKTSSDVQINGVSQLATASRYSVDKGGVLDTVLTDATSRSILSGSAVNFADNTKVSNVTGSLSITYGKSAVTLNFSESDIFNTEEEFLQAIKSKLAEPQNSIAFSNGSKLASEVIDVEIVNGEIKFSDKNSGSGNNLYISGATGKMAETFGEYDFTPANNMKTLALGGKDLTSPSKIIDQIAGQAMTFNLDGVTKKITLPTAEELQKYMDESSDLTITQEKAFTEMLQDKLDRVYGTAADGSSKITVNNGTNEAGKLQLGFTVAKTSNLSVNSAANAALGLSAAESTNLNTAKTLGELLGNDLQTVIGNGTLLKAEGAVTKQTNGTYKDAKGNLVNADGERLGKDGNLLYGYDLEISGTKIGTYTRDTTLESVLVGINSNTDAGLRVSYSGLTNQFVFNSSETGAGHQISIGEGLGEAIFGSFKQENYTQGQDAVINMTVNGSNVTVSRSSNTFDVDGLSVTLNETFNSTNGNFDFQVGDNAPVAGAITFTSKADSDKIVDNIKTFVTDMNAILKSLREGFSTLPSTKSNNSKYEPLTDKDRESMTESAINAYEEKAKQGLLFGDRDLSALYNKLVSAFTPGSTDGAALRSMGITTSYTNGLTQIELDETKLRSALSSNPDSVRDAFTKVRGDGSATDGLMTTLKSTLDAYASVDTATKGILISKAGSKYSATSLLKNSLKSQMDSLSTQIEKWQDKMSSKVDYYTRQFTQLETLIARMNEQSNSIANLMSGGV